MMAELLLKNDHGVKDRPGLRDRVGLDGAETIDLGQSAECLDGASPTSVSRAKSALAHSRIYDLRRLAVLQDGDAVVLRGRVSSFYHKQLAQEVVRSATDGAEVVNALRVVYHADRRDTELDRAG